jgi:hypothetical protein
LTRRGEEISSQFITGVQIRLMENGDFMQMTDRSCSMAETAGDPVRGSAPELGREEQEWIDTILVESRSIYCKHLDEVADT